MWAMGRMNKGIRHYTTHRMWQSRAILLSTHSNSTGPSWAEEYIIVPLLTLVVWLLQCFVPYRYSCAQYFDVHNYRWLFLCCLWVMARSKSILWAYWVMLQKLSCTVFVLLLFRRLEPFYPNLPRACCFYLIDSEKTQKRNHCWAKMNINPIVWNYVSKKR